MYISSDHVIYNMEMDISDIDRFDFDLFKKMIDSGPITVYSLSNISNRAHPTVHRHFKELEADEYIRVYRTEDHRTGQKKKFYGPTIQGIFWFCTLFKEYHKRLDFIIDKWKGEEPFLKELVINGFDLKLLETDPVYFKNIFKKFAKFYADSWYEVVNYVPTQDTWMAVGSFLIGLKHPKKYSKIMKELFQAVPGFKIQTLAGMIGMMAYLHYITDTKSNNPLIDNKIKEFFE